MIHDSRFTRIEELLDKIHTIVMKIENARGVKIDAVGEGLYATTKRLDGIEKRLDSVENRLNRVETHLDGVKMGLDHVENRMSYLDKGFGSIKNANPLLQSIANEYESRGRMTGSVNGARK